MSTQNLSIRRRTCTFKKFCEENPQFHLGTLRRLYFENRRNFRDVCIRYGRLLHIDVDLFEAWYAAGGQGEGTDGN